MNPPTTPDTKALPTNKPPKQDERGSGSDADKKQQHQSDDERAKAAKNRAFTLALMDTVRLAESLVGSNRAVLMIDVNCTNDSLVAPDGVVCKKVPGVTLAGNLEYFDLVVHWLNITSTGRMPNNQENPKRATIVLDIYRDVIAKTSTFNIRGDTSSLGYVVEMLNKAAEELDSPSEEPPLEIVCLHATNSNAEEFIQSKEGLFSSDPFGQV